MPTTSNFGWTTPADTDLVKDGAAAIRTLGNGIDTSLVDLKGGTTNQVLAKNSNTDLDFKWVADATGIPATIIDAKGDLIAGTAADTAGRLAIGTNGQVLTADSAEATGIKWASPIGGMTLLSTTSHSSATTTINVTPTGYNYLYILQTNFYNSGDTQKLRINGDTGTEYNYIVQSWDGNAGTSSTAPSTSRGQRQTSALLYNNGTDATYYGTAVTIIYDPNDTGKNKVITNWSSGQDSATFSHNNFGMCSYLAAGALTSITLFGTSSQSGTVYIYGVK